MSKIKLSELLGYGGRAGPFSHALGSGYLYSQPTPATVWTVNHNLGQKYVTVEVIDHQDQVLTGRYDYPVIQFVDENTLTITFTYPIVGHALITSGTDTLTVTTPTGNVQQITTGYIYSQPTPTPSWTVNHNLGEKYVNVEVINASDQVENGRYDYPTITFIDQNTLYIAFTYSVAGHAVITSGVPNSVLANIVANSSGVGSTYSNANVAAYLPIYHGNVSSTFVNFDAGILGPVQTPTGLDVYVPSGKDWAQLNYNNQNFVAALANGIEIDAGTYSWTFGNTGGFGFPDGTIQTTAYTGPTYSNITAIGNLTVGGNVVQQGAYYETYSNISNTGGNLTCNFNLGSTFYAALTANVTANFTNVNAIASTVTGATIVVDQGATAYRIANVQVNGVNQTVKWVGAIAGAGTAGNTDVMSFSLIHLGGGAYRVLGQISNYG